MEERDKLKNWECLPRLPTGIRGLDKVLYGGIDANFLTPCGVDGEEILVLGPDRNYRIFDVLVSSPVLDENACHYLEKLNFFFLFFSMVGKLALALVLYWTVYKFRFIYFVITKNLALT